MSFKLEVNTDFGDVAKLGVSPSFTDCGMVEVGAPVWPANMIYDTEYGDASRIEVYRNLLLKMVKGTFQEYGYDGIRIQKAVALLSDAVGGESHENEPCVYEMMTTAGYELQKEGKLQMVELPATMNPNSGNKIVAWLVRLQGYSHTYGDEIGGDYETHE